MYSACIAVVDATRGRLFSFHRSANEDGVHETLVEADILENDQAEIDFARFVLARLRELGDEQGAERLILCAAPRMLGHLRASSQGILRDDQDITEVARDFASLTATELRSHLADRHALPPTLPR
jgi:protein required for attachment to host cells